MNPCRGVPASSAGPAVNNFSIVKIEGYAVLRDTVPKAGRELDERNLMYWSSDNRHKEGRSFTYGSITEQEKLIGSAKMP